MEKRSLKCTIVQSSCVSCHLPILLFGWHGGRHQRHDGQGISPCRRLCLNTRDRFNTISVYICSQMNSENRKQIELHDFTHEKLFPSRLLL